MPDYIPRLTVELREDQARKLSDKIPHGLRKPLFQALVDDVISMLDKHGTVFIAAVISRDMSYKDFCSFTKGEPNGNDS
jgi:hypothetical protein